MNLKENFTTNYRNVKSWADHNAPAILLGTGLFSFGVSLYSMYHDAPKAQKALEELHEKREEIEVLPSKPAMIFEDACTVLKYTWKDILLASFGGFCCFKCYDIQTNRLTAAIALNASNVELLKLTREKMKEELGEKRAAEVQQKVAEEIVNKDSEVTKEMVITQPGEMLFKDCHTGRYFKSTKDEVLKIENDLNRRLYQGMEMFISLNEFYDELNMAHIKIGDNIGFTYDVPPRFTMEYADLAEDGRPCCLLDYDIELRACPW